MIRKGNRDRRRAPLRTGFWLIPVRDEEGCKAEEIIGWWLEEDVWGMRDVTWRRCRSMLTGDKVCFYAAKRYDVLAMATIVGVVEAEVPPHRWPEKRTDWRPGIYELPLGPVRRVEPPVHLDADLRERLNFLKGYGKHWGVRVRGVRCVDAHDFALLTGQTMPDETNS